MANSTSAPFHLSSATIPHLETHAPDAPYSPDAPLSSRDAPSAPSPPPNVGEFDHKNELCQIRLDVCMLDRLVHEYCVYRGIMDSANKSPSTANLANTSCRDYSSINLYCGNSETSVNNVDSGCVQEANGDSANMQVFDVEVRCASEATSSHEDCSTSNANHLQSSRRVRRSRYFQMEGGARDGEGVLIVWRSLLMLPPWM